MSDPVEAIAAQLRRLERQVRALATSARAPHTSVQNGTTRWLDEGGTEKVAITTDPPALRVWNQTGTHRVLDIEAGRGVFPLDGSPWQIDLFAPAAATPRRARSTSTDFTPPLFWARLSLVTDWVHWEFDALPQVGFDAGELAIGVRLYGGGAPVTHGPETQIVVANIGGFSPQALRGDLQIPDQVCAVGQVALLSVYARRTAGSGGVDIGPFLPVACVAPPPDPPDAPDPPDEE